MKTLMFKNGGGVLKLSLASNILFLALFLTVGIWKFDAVKRMILHAGNKGGFL